MKKQINFYGGTPQIQVGRAPQSQCYIAPADIELQLENILIHENKRLSHFECLNSLI